MSGPIYLDLAQQERALINGVSISIKFWPSSNPFRLMTSEEKPDFKVKIQEATLKICQLTVNPQIMLAHEKALSHSPAIYPFLRSDIKTFTMAEGIRSYRIDNLFNGDIPIRLVVGLVAGEAYSGSYTKNPYNFANYQMDSLGFYIDGNPSPHKPFTLKFDETQEGQGSFASAYLSLFGEKEGQNFGNDIQIRDYPRGYALYRFDLGEEHHIVKKGNTRLELSFSTKLPHVVTVIVYAHFPALMRIDKSRKIFL
jgi:hypothetical protein